MKNFEKYVEAIVDMWDNDKSICEFVKKYTTNGFCSRECHNCYDILKKWLLEEYVPEIDWLKVPVNTPVWVRNYSNEEWKKRFFAIYIPNAENSFFCLYDGEKLCWAKGASGWRYCHLDDEVDPTPFLKEV